MKRKDTGILSEKLAGDFLKKQGYHILETNYRYSHGEIDIVARHKEFLVFIEVRTKTSLEFGSPEESITPAKQERMRAAAFHYHQTHDNLLQLWRIDVVAVELDKKRGYPVLSSLKMRWVMAEAYRLFSNSTVITRSVRDKAIPYAA